MTYQFSKRSLQNLNNVHPLLVSVVERALTLSTVDFSVIEGLRTLERQKELFSKGATKTLKSRHLTGHAVDLAPIVDGQIPWNDLDAFNAIKIAMFKAAEELGVTLRWGGDWNGNNKKDEAFYDSPHFELPYAIYG